VIASGRHRPGLAAGDAIGANLTMLTLVLGLAALARPLPFGGRVRGYALWSALAGGLAALAVAGRSIGRWQGGLLLAAYLAGVTLLWLRERKPPVIGDVAEGGEPNSQAYDNRCAAGLPGLAFGSRPQNEVVVRMLSVTRLGRLTRQGDPSTASSRAQTAAGGNGQDALRRNGGQNDPSGSYTGRPSSRPQPIR